EDFIFHPGLQPGIEKWTKNFYPLIKIPRHPVGAGNISLFVSAIFKIEDAAMFEESTDDAAHHDIIADPGNSRAQRAHSTNIQIDLYACLRSAIQRLDHVFVEQGVHLGDNARRPSR